MWLRGLPPVPLWYLHPFHVERFGRFEHTALLLWGSVIALLLLPWVVTMAAWLPRGRMALGGAAVLASAITFVTVAVLDSCHKLADTLAGSTVWWVAYAFMLGAIGAWVSLVVGRRGGGAARSAKVGAALVGVGLLPPATWLGAWVQEYHHPDLDALACVNVLGVTPDLRYALAHGLGGLPTSGLSRPPESRSHPSHPRSGSVRSPPNPKYARHGEP